MEGTRCGAGAGPPRPHRPHPGHVGNGTLAARSRGRAAGRGTAPNTRRPSQRWKAPPRGCPSTTPTPSNAPKHQRTSPGTSAPHPLLLGTATQQWRNPRHHARHAPDLRRWTKHTRSSGRWDSQTAKETPHKGTRDLEALPEPPTGGAPAEPAPPAGSVPAICPAWKRGHPWRRPRGGLPLAPAAEGLSLAATLQRHPDKQARHFLQTGTVPATPPDSEWRWDAGVAQPLPGPWTFPLWYLPMGTLAHATQAVKGAFPQPLLPGVALLRSLQAGAAWVRWKEGKGRSSPYFPMVQGQALIHAEGMGTVEWGAIVPGTACRWITAAAPQPMRSPPACHRLLRMVPSLAPQHAFTRDLWKAVLSHTREWLTSLGARYPPGPVLEQLTAPTPGVLHALHRASALTKQLNDEVLDLALEPLRVLYPQTHIPPAGTSNRLARLGLQRRVEAAHPGGVVEQWLTLRSPSTAEGHWYLHQLLFRPRAAPEHRRQNPYHTHLERRGAQNYPQPVPPALPPGQDPEALQQGPPLDTATTVQQRGSDGADGAKPDCTNCGAVAWMAACRHLA